MILSKEEWKLANLRDLFVEGLEWLRKQSDNVTEDQIEDYLDKRYKEYVKIQEQEPHE